MVRVVRAGNTASLTSADEALLFSIYYAAITSMDEDEVRVSPDGLVRGSQRSGDATLHYAD